MFFFFFGKQGQFIDFVNSACLFFRLYVSPSATSR